MLLRCTLVYLQRKVPHLLSDLHGSVVLRRLIELLGEAGDGPLGHPRHLGQDFDAECSGNLKRKNRSGKSKVRSKASSDHRHHRAKKQKPGRGSASTDHGSAWVQISLPRAFCG